MAGLGFMRCGAAVIFVVLAVMMSPVRTTLASTEGSCPFAAGASSEGPTGFHARPLPSSYSGGLKEFSVVYTERALNHMSAPFVRVMRDLSEILNGVYNAAATVVVPGSGTFAMEAVARQLARGKKVLVIRNGYFSYRWSDIFDQTDVASEVVVLKATLETGARRDATRPQVKPRTVADIVAAIERHKPAVVFAPHVETSTGVMFPDEELKAIAAAAHGVGALFVLDCIASGTVWVDMRATGVDVIISAPQKGWSGHACAGLVMLSESALEVVRDGPPSDSMALNLRKWLEVMDAYLAGGFAYYATMPTDCLRLFRDAALETREYGFDRVKSDFLAMGGAVTDMLEAQGLTLVAAPGYRAPGVAVVYVGDKAAAARFKAAGLQVAAGVPYMLETQPEMATVRFGLFGLDKVRDAKHTVTTLKAAVEEALDGVER